MAEWEEAEKLNELMGQALGKVVVRAMKPPFLLTFASTKQTESSPLYTPLLRGKTVSLCCITKHPHPNWAYQQPVLLIPSGGYKRVLILCSHFLFIQGYGLLYIVYILNINEFFMITSLDAVIPETKFLSYPFGQERRELSSIWMLTHSSLTLQLSWSRLHSLRSLPIQGNRGIFSRTLECRGMDVSGREEDWPAPSSTENTIL